MKWGIWLGLLMIVLRSAAQEASRTPEPYRPAYHFSPSSGWIGDPDGLVYRNGLYHLFWWGHAVSPDLVHWREYPYPMKGGPADMHYFSGSVVVDSANTAGFGAGAMVACYTMHYSDSVPEGQGLSWSVDDSVFHFFPGNPVLDIGSRSFRDPQVFWYAPDRRWVMIVTRPQLHHVEFYGSSDLKIWRHLSDFGPMGYTGSDWEVPDLFELPVDEGRAGHRWVLTIGAGPNRMQYFIGNFDGTGFRGDAGSRGDAGLRDDAGSRGDAAARADAGVRTGASALAEAELWADYGADFYAARTWRGNPGGRTIWLAWLGNWSYAGRVPSGWGKGFESIPRVLSLRTFADGIRLVQAPVVELQQLRGRRTHMGARAVDRSLSLPFVGSCANSYELSLSIDPLRSDSCGVLLLEGEGRSLRIGYDARRRELFADRTNCTDFTSDVVFNRAFPVVMHAPLLLDKGLLRLHIFVDRSSVEVFSQDGRTVMSMASYPSAGQTRAHVFASDKAVLGELDCWPLSDIHFSHSKP